MKLINGNALVEVIKKENKTSSGIIFTTDIVANDEGIVVDIDPNVSHIVSIGDRVNFNKDAGTNIEYNGKDCRFLKVFDKDSPRTDIILVYGK
jgi:co-chaperonin GroES (HSP10)